MKKGTKFLLRWVWVLPLLLWFALTMFANNTTIIETEDNLSLYSNDELTWVGDIVGYKPTTAVIFGDNVGKISWDDGVMVFEGDAEESAKIFFEAFLKPMIDGYIESELKKGMIIDECGIGEIISGEPDQILYQYVTTGEWKDSFKPQLFLKVTDTDLSRCLIDSRLRIDLNGEIYWIRLEK